MGVRTEPGRDQPRDDQQAREEIRRLFERYRNRARRADPAAERRDAAEDRSEKSEEAAIRTDLSGS
jgi:hypothetical protein